MDERSQVGTVGVAIAVLVSCRSFVWREFLACEEPVQRAQLFAAWNRMRHSIEHVQRTTPVHARKRPARVEIAGGACRARL